MLSLGGNCVPQRQVSLRAGTLGELRQPNIVRSLVDRQRTSADSQQSPGAHLSSGRDAAYPGHPRRCFRWKEVTLLIQRQLSSNHWYARRTQPCGR
jgi:hypothetical protein